MKRKILMFSMFFLIIFVLTFGLLAYIISNKFIFSLKGNEVVSIAYGSDYPDLEYEAKLFDKNLYKYVSIRDNINLEKVGSYKVVYVLEFGLLKRQMIQVVNIYDDVDPVVVVNGEVDVTLYKGSKFKDEGASAADNYDGDITDKIVVESNLDTSKVGKYQIKYSVSDSSENSSFAIRKVNVIKKAKQSNKKKLDTEVVNISEDNDIVNYIKNNKYSVSVGYYNLSTGKSFYYNANKVYYGCSLIKTLDALYLYQNNMVTDAIKPYIEKAITVSNNNSHHYLIYHIGKKNLRNYGLSLGATYTLNTSDNFGNTNVYDQIVYLKELYKFANQYDELKNYFINDYQNYLNFDSIKFMHKYGSLSPYYHDVGIYLGDTPYLVVILTNHYNNRKIVTELSKLIYQYHVSN